tara:strand:+ start:226 stop:1074 length:849 start_codon:yes stop_codon:yes gene_type:complete
MMSMRSTPQRSAHAIRGMLAFAGLAVAMMSSGLKLNGFAENHNKLVSINQQPITWQQLNFAAQRLTGENADKLTSEQKNTVVNLLIDEELLLQRAELLGIAGTDPGVRKALARAAINQAVADALTQPIDAKQLEAFYRAHKALFVQPLRITLQAYRYPSLKEAQLALAAAVPFQNRASLLPLSPLPLHMLRRYLGSTLTDSALALTSGQTSAPVIRPDGVYLLRMIAVQAEKILPLSEVQLQVEAEYRRRGRDTALDTILGELRQQAQITVASNNLLRLDFE